LDRGYSFEFKLEPELEPELELECSVLSLLLELCHLASPPTNERREYHGKLGLLDMAQRLSNSAYT
jgi:hypothetical protein